MPTIDMAAGSMLAGCTIKLRIKGVRVLSLRARIAAAIVRLAGIVAPCGFELIEEQPQARFQDVAVERVGCETRLRIGGLAVRLDRRDREHLGAMLEAGWPALLEGARVEDVSRATS